MDLDAKLCKRGDVCSVCTFCTPHPHPLSSENPDCQVKSYLYPIIGLYPFRVSLTLKTELCWSFLGYILYSDPEMWCLGGGGGGGGWLSRSGHWSTAFLGHFREYNPEKTQHNSVFRVRLTRMECGPNGCGFRVKLTRKEYKPMTQISGSLYRNVTRKRVNMLTTLFCGSHWPGWSAAPTDADSGSNWPGKSTNQWLRFPVTV